MWTVGAGLGVCGGIRQFGGASPDRARSALDRQSATTSRQRCQGRTARQHLSGASEEIKARAIDSSVVGDALAAGIWSNTRTLKRSGRSVSSTRNVGRQLRILMLDDGEGTCLAYGKANLVEHFFIDSTAASGSARNQPREPYLIRRRWYRKRSSSHFSRHGLVDARVQTDSGIETGDAEYLADPISRRDDRERAIVLANSFQRLDEDTEASRIEELNS